MKKVLITGASGFVGFHLVEAAKNKGWEVHALVRESSKVTEIKSFVDKFLYTKMSDINALLDLFDSEKYDYVIHAAALTKAKTEKEMFDVNVGYTENLVKAAFSGLNRVKRFVFVSSLAAIGPISYDLASITELSPYNPVTVYGRSKKAAEIMLQDNFANNDITVIRPTAVYGPREKDLFILFDTLNKGLDPYIGKKEQKLSFVYVKDLVDVLLSACEYHQSGLQTFNISDGRSYSKYAMADIYKSVFPKKPIRLHIPLSIVKVVANISQFLYKNSSKTPVIYPERLGELTAENWSCDISKAKVELGFAPSFDLQKGLTETLNWYKANKWL